MYPNHPLPQPPGQKSEYDQYPLQDTQFAQQPVDRAEPFRPQTVDPFADPYPDQPQHGYDHQPLLRDTPQFPSAEPPYPPQQQQPGFMAPPSPQPPYGAPTSPNMQYGGAPPSPNMHYGGAPRRQPRRYKTSTCILYHGFK